MSRILWEKNEALNDCLLGFTSSDIINDMQYTYRIDGTTLKVDSRNGHYAIDYLRFASVKDAKKCAELIQKGRIAE